MSLLALALSTVSIAHADMLSPPSLKICFPSTLNCLRVLDSDGEIMPPDWYMAEYERLDGQFNYVRVVVAVESGRLDMRIAGVELSDRYLSERESGSRGLVYYVPTDGAEKIEFYVQNRGEDTAWFNVTLEGAAFAGY